MLTEITNVGSYMYKCFEAINFRSHINIENIKIEQGLKNTYLNLYLGKTIMNIHFVWKSLGLFIKISSLLHIINKGFKNGY